MAYTTIDKPTDYFNTVLYTGNGSTQSITGVGFQPDFTWIKQRDGAVYHQLANSVTGVTKYLNSNDNRAEQTETTQITSFDSDGFSLGNKTNTNDSGDTYVAWNWLASNTTASNTDGDITTTVSVNQTAGFSIITFSGSDSDTTIGHGLGAKPNLFILKSRGSANTPQDRDWETLKVIILKPAV